MAERRAKTQEVVATPVKEAKRNRPPARTPEAREAQLVSLAVDLAEKQLREGTVSSQVHSIYLKMASPREKLERERLEKENQMLEAKIEAIASGARIEELYGEALSAMRMYKEGPASVEAFDD